MADFKLTLFFRGSTSGWTESFYATGLANHGSVVTNFGGEVGLVQKRAAIMGTTYWIQGYRVSNVDRQRDGIAGEIPGGIVAGGFPGGVGDQAGSMTPDNAVNVRTYASPSQWRSYLVRGLPTQIFNGAGTGVLPGRWRDALTAYVNVLRRDNWCLKIAARGATVGLASVRQLNGQIISITTDAPIPAFAVNDAIQIFNARGMSNLNGRYRVVESLAANEYSVVKRIRVSNGTLVANTGRVCRIGFTYPQITLGALQGVANRQTGRPSNASRGRAPTRRD